MSIRTPDPLLSQRLALAALVVANLLVALQVLLRGWGYYEMLLIYWFEAVIIGGVRLQVRRLRRRRGSHGFSFVRNFLLEREYARLSIFGLIFWPYARLSLVALILGLGLELARLQGAIASTTAFAVAMVPVKIAADAATHLVEHRWLASRPVTPDP